jgi:hypothetical protein
MESLLALVALVGIGWFFYGCSDANPPWYPNFLGPKKGPPPPLFMAICWRWDWTTTGRNGTWVPGLPNIGLKTMRTQIRSWYHSGLPNTRVYAEREINTKSQWFAYELLKLQSDLAWYITNCNMWCGGFLKWGYPQMRKMFHYKPPFMETSMSCTTLSKQLQSIAWPKLPGSSAWVKYNLIIRTYMSRL